MTNIKSEPPTGKNIVISCGPIPARLDAVKFITNRFKGGLAIKTAKELTNRGHTVTIVAWDYTDIPTDIMAPKPAVQNGETITYPGIKEVIRVHDVFDYYNWFKEHANDYDAFIMAAAVANLTPVQPYPNKFPSHKYKPGKEFDIKFMIAPRAIDIIKKINPRTCLIGYKLFDEPNDDKLIEIARHTRADAKANIIFANRPSEAKTRKIAVTADNAAFSCNFDEHVDLIDRAIRQTYFRTEVSPLTEQEQSDPDVTAALAMVRYFETTFDKHGTVAIPAGNGRFATTARGHKDKEPVLVRSVDPNNHIIYASGKATLNAPMLSNLVDNGHYVVHRHYDDPKAAKAPERKYIFPGTVEEYDSTRIDNPIMRIEQPHHGYIQVMSFKGINWDEYHKTFPERYFTTRCDESIRQRIQDCKHLGRPTLEIGGNNEPIGEYSYDPYVLPKNDSKPVTMEDILDMEFEFTFCRNAICYLHQSELSTILKHSETFMANAPAIMPDFHTRNNEVAVKIKAKDANNQDIELVMHYLILDDDQIIQHSFYVRDYHFYEKLGLTVTKLDGNTIILTKGINFIP